MSESSSNSDSEDSRPLAALRSGDGSTSKNRRPPSSDESSDGESEEAEFDGGEEEEVFDNNEEESEDDFIVDDEVEEDGDFSHSDSDDSGNSPLSSLKSKKNSTPTKKEKSAAKKKKATPKKSKTKVAKKTKRVKAEVSTKPSSTIVSAPSELYAKSTKGKLIQEVLCRWWYAYTWPDPKIIPPETPPDCDALDGFPGVYVCTSGDNVGKIIDYRDHSTCPNFKNFVRKSSEELKELLETAIERQRAALIQAEGTGTQTEIDLDKLEKWAKKLNSTKADKEAEKVLKAAGLKLK